MQNAAEQRTLARTESNRMRDSRDRATAANSDASEELAGHLQENPRYAQLMHLAGERQCTY